jgi:dTDP-4-dehydrorhamnose reductase
VKIAIFGVGFLGSKLMKLIPDKYTVIGADINPLNSLVHKIDATNRIEVENFLINEKPDVVIDTIALSSYFACEKDPDLCKLLNYETAKYISNACKIIDARMVFISSSYLFDGKKGGYKETDIPNSTNQYAQSKVLAENIVLELNNSIVVRLESLYGYSEEIQQIMFGTNTFQKPVQVAFPDILRSPVFVDDVPKIIIGLIERKESGIFHIASSIKLRWLDFLKELASLTNSEDKISIVDSSDWILNPPHDSSLDSSKINNLGMETTPVEEAFLKLRKALQN